MLLLDEITVDMDVVGRLDLLKFFREECEARGATLIYATHIFDGLEAWATHVAYLADGRLKIGEPLRRMSVASPCIRLRQRGHFCSRQEPYHASGYIVQRALLATDPVL